MDQAASDESFDLLLRRLAEDDREAWAALQARLGDDMRRIAARASGDQALAEDAVQEALLRLRAHAGRWTPGPGHDARRWILGITANTALELARTQRRARARDRRAGIAALGAAAAADPCPGEAVSALRDALADLPVDQREAVTMHHLAGLPARAIAERAGVSEVAVRTRICRGLARLRAALRRRLGDYAGLSLCGDLARLGGRGPAVHDPSRPGATHPAQPSLSRQTLLTRTRGPRASTTDLRTLVRIGAMHGHPTGTTAQQFVATALVLAVCVYCVFTLSVPQRTAMRTHRPAPSPLRQEPIPRTEEPEMPRAISGELGQPMVARAAPDF